MGLALVWSLAGLLDLGQTLKIVLAVIIAVPSLWMSYIVIRLAYESEILRNELVARYHFQTGRAIAALDTDPYVREALDVLGNGTYGEVLAGTGNTGN